MKTELPTTKVLANNPQINIAITGKMRSGKNTVANILSHYLSNPKRIVRFYGFGDHLKEYARKVFPDEHVNGKKPRDLYQWFGQTMRQRDDNIWIRHTAKDINHEVQYTGTMLDDTELVNIITDLRQPNEYEFCKKNGFYIIKIECDDVVRLKRIRELNDNFKKEDLHHETESYIDSFEADYVLTTTHANKFELNQRVLEVIKHILKQEERGSN